MNDGRYQAEHGASRGTKPLRILGTGSSLPARIVLNDELEALTGMPRGRIRDLFGVERRHWSRGTECADPPEGQRCSDLAAAAGMAALADAGLHPGDVDLLVAVTTSPDYLNPPFDALVARKIGLRRCMGFTLSAPCTGVFRATALAEAMIAAGRCRRALVIAAEALSPFFRFGPSVPKDHCMNSVLYADGAGAWVLSGEGADDPAIELIDLDLAVLDETPGVMFPGMLSATPPSPERFSDADDLGYHDFRRVLAQGGRMAAEAAERVMKKLAITSDSVSLFVTHQATGNMHRIAASYGLPPEKIPINIDRVGNTVSASILVLLDELKRAGKLSRGDLLVLHTAESSTWSTAGMAIRW